MKRILFLDDCNMFEARDPLAYLVEVSEYTSTSVFRVLEESQIGVYRIGGKWEEIMKDGGIEHKLISKGRKSKYKKSDYDEDYILISGNY